MRAKLAIMIASIGAVLVLATVPAWAHHAFAAEFDAHQPVKFKGVVTKMEWTNPHGLWKNGPSRRGRRMSCSGEALRNRLCFLGPKSSSMATDQRTAHIGQTEEISRFLTAERCSSVVLRRMLLRRNHKSV
jgi:Family of unknown function (DUF6152)